MHELITVALVLTCLCALVILVACIWAIVETEIKISIRVLPPTRNVPSHTAMLAKLEVDMIAKQMQYRANHTPWYFGLVRDGMDSDQLAALIDELDQVRGIALDELASYYTHEIYIDGVKQQ